MQGTEPRSSSACTLWHPAVALTSLRWRARWVVASVALNALGACGQARSLDLFEKPPPAAVMPTACGAEAMCAPEQVCAGERCVECVLDGDCKREKPACLDNICVECQVNEQCPMDKLCHVEVSACSEPCEDAEQCRDKKRPVCDPERALCVECLLDTDCGKEKWCDAESRTCVDCTTDANCPDAGRCDEQHECGP